jgi:hypothetical protein
MGRETDGDDDECHKVDEAKAIRDNARFMKSGAPVQTGKE